MARRVSGSSYVSCGLRNVGWGNETPMTENARIADVANCDKGPAECGQ